jgi:hypothetical protein
MNRRAMALCLLIALLAAFGTALPVHDEPGTFVPNTVASSPAPALPLPHSAPEMPLAGAVTAEHPPAAPRADHVEAPADAHPRAHRQPAADRAPPSVA